MILSDFETTKICLPMPAWEDLTCLLLNMQSFVQDGYITANDAEKIGSASVLLGAGRQKKGDPLDFAAGITLHKKRGDYVHKGESLATFYGAADKFEAAAAEYRSGLVYGAEKPEEAPLVYALVTKDGVERY